jgi:hemerythrin superfamily protein
MSFVDKIVAAVTPRESGKDRAEARAKAAAAAQPGDWLSLVLDHHAELEEALATVEEGVTAEERSIAFQEFAVLLTGHALAEEGVLYPGLSEFSETGHADTGYAEQAMVKMQMAVLEKLDPLSQDFEDKLEHVKGALLHHMYEEESGWFLNLKKQASPDEQERMTVRYAEEFDRYVGDAGVIFEEDEEEEDE